MKKSRRTFLGQTFTAGSLIALVPSWSRLYLPADPIPASAVKEYVGAAHNKLDRVKELLAEYPHLLNASWDLGDGDFETAVGASGHVGYRECAEFLLSQGARADLFVLTMLGETAIVKSTLERFPNMLNSLGAHGYTLLHHARAGKEAAAELYEYLSEKGLKDFQHKIYNKS